MKNEEIVKVSTTKVKCGGDSSSHPEVYLEMGPDKMALCPYCTKKFILIEERDESETED